MVDNNYVVQPLSPLGGLTEVSDDGSGIDWLVMTNEGNGAIDPNDIRLGATVSNVQWYLNLAVHTLRVVGLIENVRGSDLKDNIEGNLLGNLLYGDSSRGIGMDDTISGSGGNDTIYGGGGVDWIGGSGDDDLLFGDGGNDTITGGSGVDTLVGGAGRDTLEGGDGNTVADNGDTVSYEGSAGGVRVSLTARAWTTGQGGDAEGDRLIGFTDIIGSSRADVLVDTVRTALEAGENDNTFFGGAGRDRLLMGGGNDSAYGGTGDDILKGGTGSDHLAGGRDNDTLVGGRGKDILTGNSGADHFVLETLADSGKRAATRDTITDFSSVEGDKIDLQDLDAQKSTTAHEAFDFIGAAGFQLGVEGQLQVIQSGSGWLVSGEVDGDGIADFSIFVLSATAPVETDFLLF